MVLAIPTGATVLLPPTRTTAAVAAGTAAAAVVVTAVVAVVTSREVTVVVVTTLPVALATDSGAMESTFLARPIPVSSANSLELSTIHQSSTPVSTSRSTTTSPSKPPVKMSLRPSISSQLLLWMSTFAATLSWLTTRFLLRSRSTPSPSSWAVVI